MEFNEKVLDLLAEVTETEEVKDDLNLNLFDEGLLDSMGTVQLLMEVESTLDITVPVSEFDRETWATPAMIIERLKEFE
ncbi:D-alanine--poly(phosphoribitol) ligase subunit 2 [Listeria grayi]|uniref:D-alanyl carrier protein n=3 Tax=Listeria grayi TaxID=1641 RepID=D7UY84_LISGR|nr:D-alanine--poly(phosphoribitol) ligase subunit DltC [Listeria grayi]EFI83871.1 D-alanine--poly(phosphoribitol) ligase, subunit 2 [Listeria grayi DSM 20601]EUJ25887.1 D-alanine--poly(phosphoribitol) ligase subunit 2 [Listeria grayi FSL F6-1183]MBC1923093.1 D-alanine--poly(phosphoribitol) ligase subunit DltC [Listeria grayi]STY44280.1 D-alanine--poly(phosphoribitol) ligase subunit 2 [Listeria grayi]VEI36087.1 D-alanine--poly(phosphoribitol) ligase subunit 2 [Listeria grayi]